MFLLAWFSPVGPVDPWNLLSPKKIAGMLFALTVIQVMGSVLAQFLGVRAGAMVTGFLGGLISSTATTAALAKRSQSSGQGEVSAEGLTFLAATTAMLFEGAAILLTGTTGIHRPLLLIFLGPIAVSGLMLYRQSRKLPSRALSLEPAPFRVLPLLKLAVFIAGILSLSKVLQNQFGQNGLIVLTFLVSLFEIHGSVVANVQLHDAGAIGVLLLGGLLAISVVSSYLSKLFLIFTMASPLLKRQAARSTLILFGSLLGSWLIFVFLAPR